MCLGQKKVKTQPQQKKRENVKTLPEPGVELETSRAAVWCVTSLPQRQLNSSIEVNLFNYFSVMGRNMKNKATFAANSF